MTRHDYSEHLESLQRIESCCMSRVDVDRYVHIFTRDAANGKITLNIANKWKKSIAKGVFRGRCAVCHKKYGKNFTFHHITYRKSEKKHSDFTSHKQYQIYIIPIILRNFREFALLCRSHHHAVETLKIMYSDKFDRLAELVNQSRHESRKV